MSVRLDDVRVGLALPPRTFPITRSDLIRYAGAAVDFTAIHWSERAARSAGFDDVIAHGMLTIALALRVATDWTGDPGSLVHYSMRFTRPVVVPDDGVGATVKVRGVVKNVDVAERTVVVALDVISQAQLVLTNAAAMVRVR